MIFKVTLSLLYPILAWIYVIVLDLTMWKMTAFLAVITFYLIVHFASLLPIFYYVCWKQNVTKSSKIYAWGIGSLSVSLTVSAGSVIIHKFFLKSFTNDMMSMIRNKGYFGYDGISPTFFETLGVFTIPGFLLIVAGLIAVVISIALARRLLVKSYSSPIALPVPEISS
jgi:hypothetical protein